MQSSFSPECPSACISYSDFSFCLHNKYAVPRRIPEGCKSTFPGSLPISSSSEMAWDAFSTDFISSDVVVWMDSRTGSSPPAFFPTSKYPPAPDNHLPHSGTFSLCAPDRIQPVGVPQVMPEYGFDSNSSIPLCRHTADDRLMQAAVMFPYCRFQRRTHKSF